MFLPKRSIGLSNKYCVPFSNSGAAVLDCVLVIPCMPTHKYIISRTWIKLKPSEVWLVEIVQPVR